MSAKAHRYLRSIVVKHLKKGPPVGFSLVYGGEQLIVHVARDKWPMASEAPWLDEAVMPPVCSVVLRDDGGTTTTMRSDFRKGVTGAISCRLEACGRGRMIDEWFALQDVVACACGDACDLPVDEWTREMIAMVADPTATTATIARRGAKNIMRPLVAELMDASAWMKALEEIVKRLGVGFERFIIRFDESTAHLLFAQVEGWASEGAWCVDDMRARLDAWSRREVYFWEVRSAHLHDVGYGYTCPYGLVKEDKLIDDIVRAIMNWGRQGNDSDTS